MYKKKPLNFAYEQVSRKQRLAETLKTRESSRFKRLSVIRSIDDSDSSFTPMKNENSSKIEVSAVQQCKAAIASGKKQPVSRLDMLRKWKEEKMLKKELDAKEKKKPFYVGRNTKNAANNKNPPNFKSSFSFHPKDFNSTTSSSKSNTPLSKIQPKSVIPCATKQKTPSFLPSKIPNVRQTKPVTKLGETVNKGFITPTFQKKCTNTAATGVSQNKSATKPLGNDKKPNNVSVPNKLVKATGLQKPLHYKSQPNPVSKLPVKPVSKVVGIIPKPTASIPKGIPDRKIQSKMPTINGNQKSTISKNLPQKMPVPTLNQKSTISSNLSQKMPVPTLNQKSTTSSNLLQKGQMFSSSNMQRKGYCFKKAITESRLQAKNALTAKTNIDKKPEEVKPIQVKCSGVPSLQKEEISIPDVPFDSSISMIKSTSFAPCDFTFRPPILMANFVLDDDDDEDNLTEVIERAKLKYMTRTSTPTKPVEENLTVQSPCSPVMKVKDLISDESTHLCKETDESCEQLAVKKLFFDADDPEPAHKNSGESSNESAEKENNNVHGSFENESSKQLIVKRVAGNAGNKTETADDKDSKLFNKYDETENNVGATGCPVSEPFEQLVVKDLACNEHITERTDENIKNLFNKHNEEDNIDDIRSLTNAPFRELVDVEKIVSDGSHVAKPVDEELLNTKDENKDDVNGTFLKESSEQLIDGVNGTFGKELSEQLIDDVNGTFLKESPEQLIDNGNGTFLKESTEQLIDGVNGTFVKELFEQLIDDVNETFGKELSEQLIDDVNGTFLKQSPEQRIDNVNGTFLKESPKQLIDDVNGTFLKESSEQLIVKEIISIEEHDFDDKNDSSLFTKCVAEENKDSSRVLIIDEPVEQLIVKELACDGQALNFENADELESVKQISDGVSEKIVKEELTFAEKSFIGDENDTILIPVSPFDDSLGDIPNIHESKVRENFQALSLESGAEIKQDEDIEFVKLEIEVQTTKAAKKKSTGAVPKRTSMFRHLSILNSVAETEEPFSKTPGRKENFTPRRSKRISDRVFFDSPKECQASNTDSPGSDSIFTPRRSTRLQRKSSGNVLPQDSFNSPLESQTSRKATPRRSMRLIDLNTPEKEADGVKKTERLLNIDFDRLNLKDGSENLDPSMFSIEFENPGEMPLKMRSKKVSLLYSPEKRKSLRKSIRGDLMSFSPSS